MAKNNIFPLAYCWLIMAHFLLHKGKSNVGRDKDQQKIIKSIIQENVKHKQLQQLLMNKKNSDSRGTWVA